MNHQNTFYPAIVFVLTLFSCSNASTINSAEKIKPKEQETASIKKTAFNVWAAADPHVTVDAIHGVEPLQLAIRQSEGYWDFLPKMELKLGGIPPAFDWDIMLLAGDFTSSQFPPKDGIKELSN